MRWVMMLGLLGCDPATVEDTGPDRSCEGRYSLSTAYCGEERVGPETLFHDLDGIALDLAQFESRCEARLTIDSATESCEPVTEIWSVYNGVEVEVLISACDLAPQCTADGGWCNAGGETTDATLERINHVVLVRTTTASHLLDACGEGAEMTLEFR